jgi:hypothetical protein
MASAILHSGVGCGAAMLGGDNDAVSRYSQVTDPGRFRVMHTAAEGLLARVSAAFEVQLLEGVIDQQLSGTSASPGRTVRIVPADPAAAPVTIHFSDFPGIRTRYGSWVIQSWPDCGCDACDDDPAALAEDLVSEVERVAAGCLEEHLRRWPRPSLAWCLRERMTDTNRFARRSRTIRSSWGRLSRDEVRELQRQGGRGRRGWQPWPSRG